ncbi:MAG: hypothetical protein R3E48_20010 [Burkholderiaceae bacterium]
MMLAILRQGVGEQAGRLPRVFYRLHGGVLNAALVLMATSRPAARR